MPDEVVGGKCLPLASSFQPGRKRGVQTGWFYRTPQLALEKNFPAAGGQIKTSFGFKSSCLQLGIFVLGQLIGHRAAQSQLHYLIRSGFPGLVPQHSSQTASSCDFGTEISPRTTEGIHVLCVAIM